MKKLVLVLISSIIVLVLDAQTNNVSNVYYGLTISGFHTGSSYDSNYAINSNVQKGRRSLEMGIIYQESQNRVSGGGVKYKVYLGKNAFMEKQNARSGIIVKTYLHYNCIYHNTKVTVPHHVPVNSRKSAFPELPAPPGTVATMEHYSGFGMQLFISRNICIDASAGLGTYIGSLDKKNAPNTIGIHKDNHGFVLAFEFGLGYRFGI
jgi:hypothetical protein